MKLPLLGILVLLATVSVLALGIIWLLTNVPASISYCVSAHYAQMPSNDEALEDRLKTQPAVVPWTVHTGRKGEKLYVTFIRSEPICGKPAFPDLAGICDQ